MTDPHEMLTIEYDDGEHFVCLTVRSRAASAHHPSGTGMLDIRNEIELAAPKAIVFSLLTTPHYWPQWHLSTRAVSETTAQPYRLGESFEEQATIATQSGGIVWTCVALDAPHTASIESREKNARISYQLGEADGRTTIRHQLTVDPLMLRGLAPSDAAAHQLLWRVSQESLVRFRSFVSAKHPRTPSAVVPSAG